MLRGYDASLKADPPSTKLPHEWFQAELSKGVDSVSPRSARRVEAVMEDGFPTILSSRQGSTDTSKSLKPCVSDTDTLTIPLSAYPSRVRKEKMEMFC